MIWAEMTDAQKRRAIQRLIDREVERKEIPRRLGTTAAAIEKFAFTRRIRLPRSNVAGVGAPEQPTGWSDDPRKRAMVAHRRAVEGARRTRVMLDPADGVDVSHLCGGLHG